MLLPLRPVLATRSGSRLTGVATAGGVALVTGGTGAAGGALVGAAASLLVRAVLNAMELQMPPPPGGTRGVVLFVRFFPMAYAAGFVLMTATLLVASWWPARRASRLNPVEALAHV